MVFNDESNDYGDFKDPIYDGESDENHYDELNTTIWDVYEDNDAQDKIYDMSQDCDFDDKINLNEHLDYEEFSSFGFSSSLLLCSPFVEGRFDASLSCGTRLTNERGRGSF